MKWSNEDDENLKKFSEAGFTAAEAGDLIGRTRNAVLGRAHRLGISFKFIKEKTPIPTEESVKVNTYISEERKPSEDNNSPKYLYESLLDLRQNQCRWPINTKFCEEEKFPGSSYCEKHLIMSYRQGGRS